MTSYILSYLLQLIIIIPVVDVAAVLLIIIIPVVDVAAVLLIIIIPVVDIAAVLLIIIVPVVDVAAIVSYIRFTTRASVRYGEIFHEQRAE